MWEYEKKLQYPVRITKPDPRMARLIITQYGGADGELAASLRYLSQRFTMPTQVTKGILNDIGREAPEMFPLETAVFSGGFLRQFHTFSSCIAPFHRQ